jgi:hypothetical protein
MVSAGRRAEAGASAAAAAPAQANASHDRQAARARHRLVGRGIGFMGLVTGARRHTEISITVLLKGTQAQIPRFAAGTNGARYLVFSMRST